MTTSARLQELILEYMSDSQNHSVQEMKQHLAQSGIGEYTEGQFAGSINTLLRNGSIKKIDRGVYAIEGRNGTIRKCFVVSPIGEDGSPTRINADKLFRHIIAPVCKSCDFDAIRADKMDNPGSITQAVIENLETADLVIADITEHNPNVFYEMGYRTRTNKPIIHLRRKGEALPFDINAVRTFEYDLTDIDSVDETKERLQRTIQAISYPTSDGECNNDDIEAVPQIPDTVPILYQILDAVSELKTEVKNNNSETIKAVISSVQSSQPSMSAETALQVKMLESLMQNPTNFMKLLELSQKLPQQKK